MADITYDVSAPAPVGGKPASGRNIFDVGNRKVGKFRLTAHAGTTTYATGGIAFDPRANGFDAPVAEVSIVADRLIASVANYRYQYGYDYVNKKIVVFDQTDHDEPNGDDLSADVLTVTVTSE